MKDISRESFIRLIKLVILLIPMSFLFHYLETSLSTNASIFEFLGTFLLMVLAGIISVKTKPSFIISLNTLSIFYQWY